MHERRESPEPPPLHQRLLAAYREAFDRAQSMPNRAHLRALASATHTLEPALDILPGRFALGHIVATPGAIDTLSRGQHRPAEFLLPHHHGDWSDLGPEDLAEHERALREGRHVSSIFVEATAVLGIIGAHGCTRQSTG